MTARYAHGVVVEEDDLLLELNSHDEKQIRTFRDIIRSANHGEDLLTRTHLRPLIRVSGIPTPAQRSIIWRRLLHLARDSSDRESDSTQSSSYQRLHHNEPSHDVLLLIRQDVPRTFPHYRKFSKSVAMEEQGFDCDPDDAVGMKPPEGQRKLFRILKAYAVYDPSVGYCQGMAYIAAFLLIHLGFDEVKSFWAFANLMKSKSMAFDGIFAHDLVKLKILLKVLEQLIEIEIPRLHEFFLRENIGPELYCCAFFCTFFTMFFDFPTTTRIWDVFFVEGWSFLVKLVVGILKTLEDRLLRCRFIQVQSTINDYCETIQPDQLLQLASLVPLTNETLERWEERERTTVLESEWKRFVKRTTNERNRIRRESGLEKVDDTNHQAYALSDFFVAALRASEALHADLREDHPEEEQDLDALMRGLDVADREIGEEITSSLYGTSEGGDVDVSDTRTGSDVDLFGDSPFVVTTTEPAESSGLFGESEAKALQQTESLDLGVSGLASYLNAIDEPQVDEGEGIFDDIF